MGFTCCVPNCTTNRRHGEKLSTFAVPTDSVRRKKWEEKIKITFLKKRHFVCEKHFLPSEIIRSSEYLDSFGNIVASIPLKSVRLKKDVIPSCFLDLKKEDSHLIQPLKIKSPNKAQLGKKCETAFLTQEVGAYEVVDYNESEFDVEYETQYTEIINNQEEIFYEEVPIAEVPVPVHTEEVIDTYIDYTHVETQLVETDEILQCEIANDTYDSGLDICSTICENDIPDDYGVCVEPNEITTDDCQVEKYLNEDTVACDSMNYNIDYCSYENLQDLNSKSNQQNVDMNSGNCASLENKCTQINYKIANYNRLKNRFYEFCEYIKLCTFPDDWFFHIPDGKKSIVIYEVFDKDKDSFENNNMESHEIKRSILVKNTMRVFYSAFGKSIDATHFGLVTRFINFHDFENTFNSFSNLHICYGIDNIKNLDLPNITYTDYIGIIRHKECSVMSLSEQCKACEELQRIKVIHSTSYNRRIHKRRRKDFETRNIEIMYHDRDIEKILKKK